VIEASEDKDNKRNATALIELSIETLNLDLPLSVEAKLEVMDKAVNKKECLDSDSAV
jgi:hypothetical protein